MRFDNQRRPKTIGNGDGTQSKRLLTGHGAPFTPAKSRLLSNNWGASQLRKLDSPYNQPNATGQGRFVQPPLAATAVVPPPGLGNPRGERSMD